MNYDDIDYRILMLNNEISSICESHLGSFPVSETPIGESVDSLDFMLFCCG